MRKLAIISLVVLSISQTAWSDNALKTVKYPLKYSPEIFSTNGAQCYYSSGNKVFNYLNIELLKAKGTLLDLQILPTGTSFYALYSGKDQNDSFLATDNILSKAILYDLNLIHPLCFCFSSDASKIIAAGAGRRINVYSILNNKLNRVKSFMGPAECYSLAVSPNMYYIAAAAGEKLYIYNYDTGKLRLTIPLNCNVRKILFSFDNSQMLVLCDNSSIYCYNTVTFEENRVYGGLDEALSFDMTKDGKYISVATSSNMVTIINTFDMSQRQEIHIPEGGLRSVAFVTLRNGSERLVYNTMNSVVFTELRGRELNYSKLLKEELGTRMDAWMKRMPGESLDEYNLRVNETSVRSQTLLYQQIIATELANRYLDSREINLEGYDFSNQILPISFGNQDIFLPVPSDDLLTFSNHDQLEFGNLSYIINEKDSFELVYAEVTNKETGKKYVYDNKERRSLDFLSLKDQFVPFELIQLSNSQGIKLDEIKNYVLDESIGRSFISSHTNVNVNTRVSHDYNADGKSVFNYSISMDYSVDAAFSEREDYPSGHYRVEESGAAKALCGIISKAFEGDFKSYIRNGKKVVISLTGTADAAQIRDAIRYNGEYGDFYNYPAFNNGVLCDITVDTKRGITSNEELAFIRAIGLKEEICRRIDGLNNMNSSYIYNIHVSDAVGARHRRVSVTFTFQDAF